MVKLFNYEQQFSTWNIITFWRSFSSNKKLFQFLFFLSFLLGKKEFPTNKSQFYFLLVDIRKKSHQTTQFFFRAVWIFGVERKYYYTFYRCLWTVVKASKSQTVRNLSFFLWIRKSFAPSRIEERYWENFSEKRFHAWAKFKKKNSEQTIIFAKKNIHQKFHDDSLKSLLAFALIPTETDVCWQQNNRSKLNLESN